MGRKSFIVAQHDKARLAKDRARRRAAVWNRKQPTLTNRKEPIVPTLDDEARASRVQHLAAAAKAAKLTDQDLLKIARPDLTAEDAVADLKRRYPAGFTVEPSKRYRDMTPAEQSAFKRKLGIRA